MNEVVVPALKSGKQALKDLGNMISSAMFSGKQAYQDGGDNWTKREGAGAMETEVISRTGAESKDITEILVYTDVGRSNAEGIAELTDLATDLTQALTETIDNDSSGKENEATDPKPDSIICDACSGGHYPLKNIGLHTKVRDTTTNGNPIPSN